MIGAYIIGEPGAGKSALVAGLTEGLDVEWRKQPVAHALYRTPEQRVAAAQIGGPHASYPGTDRLSMSVQPRAIEWVEGAPAPAVIAEGDRLATVGFLDTLEKCCDEWALVYLDTPPETLAHRRKLRGSDQNPTWLAGRRTKVLRLVAAYPERLFWLDGALAVRANVERLRKLPSFAWTAR